MRNGKQVIFLAKYYFITSFLELRINPPDDGCSNISIAFLISVFSDLNVLTTRKGLMNRTKEIHAYTTYNMIDTGGQIPATFANLSLVSLY